MFYSILKNALLKSGMCWHALALFFRLWYICSVFTRFDEVSDDHLIRESPTTAICKHSLLWTYGRSGMCRHYHQRFLSSIPYTFSNISQLEDASDNGAIWESLTSSNHVFSLNGTWARIGMCCRQLQDFDFSPLRTLRGLSNLNGNGARLRISTWSLTLARKFLPRDNWKWSQQTCLLIFGLEELSALVSNASCQEILCGISAAHVDNFGPFSSPLLMLLLVCVLRYYN